MRAQIPASVSRICLLGALLLLLALSADHIVPKAQLEAARKNRLFARPPQAPQTQRLLQTPAPTEPLAQEPDHSPADATPEHGQAAEHEPGEALIVYIVAVILVIGGICREIKKATNLPYTPQLLVAGILLGTYTARLGDLGHAFYLLLQINPHGILMIFIPTIIFESAYNSDPFTTKRQFWQIILLAGPGVVVGALLITLGFNYGLGYSNELSIAGGLTFGAIVCATDPVAVVALLKELGTPLKFNMLLEGESLLNDGTAMVFYIVFSSIYKAKGISALAIIVKFFQLSFGGVALGAVACWVSVVWLRKIVKDEILTISITFMTCYLTFFVGETYLGVSGILAIVSLGVLMSMYGKVRINPESEHSVHIVWSFIQYVLETVIFVLTGGYIGYYTIYKQESTITSSDWVKMLLFYFVMTAARYLMIWIMKPLLDRTGYPVSHKDIIVLTYGGLRGAIALCLGLMVYTDDDYSPRFKDLVLFYLTGMITITVLLNGLTMKGLMKLVDFLPENKLRNKVKNTLVKSLVVAGVKHQEEIKHNKFLTLANWDSVNELAGLNDIIKSQRTTKEKELQTVDSFGSEANLVEIRYRVYRQIKAQFWVKFEESFCSSSVVTVLKECIDFCMDNLEDKIWIYECVSDNIVSIDKLQSLLSYRNTILIGWFARSFINSHLLQTYEMLSTLIVCLSEIIEDKPHIPLAQTHVNQIFAELAENKVKAEQQLFTLSDAFPDLIGLIQSKQAAHMVLNHQKEKMTHEYHEGTVNDDEYNEIIDSLNSRISKLDYRSLRTELKDISDFGVLAPLFSGLDESQLSQLSAAHIKNKFPAGTVISHKGQPTTGVYMIVKGIVEDQISPDSKERFGLGSVLHWSDLLLADTTAKSTVTAITDTTAYFINKAAFEGILGSNGEFEETIYKASLGYLLKVYPPMEGSFGSAEALDDQTVTQILKNSKLITKKNSEAFTLEFGGFLFSGEIKLIDDSDLGGVIVVSNPTYISPQGNKNFKVVKTAKVLRFTETIFDDGTILDAKKSLMGPSSQVLGVPGHGSFGRHSGFKNSVLVMVNKEKDIEKLFEDIIRKKFSNLAN